nr:reverse transcriptase domain-containing protein [Tanacetum cinerariifolium]
MCDEFAKIIRNEFEMSMMGELNFFLGLQIKQMEDGIFFNQSKYIKEMLKKFSLEDSKPMKTPMSSDTKLTKDEECELVDSTKYRGMIGTLLYLTASRPDIMFSVCLCARFQEAFKDLLRACPHHGFSELHQLDTFYNTLNSKDQDSLNSAAGGNFLDKMPRECLAIIESKSKVRYLCNKPVVAKVSTNTSTFGISPNVAELKDMVKALLLDKKSQNQAPTTVKAVKESCVTCGSTHSYRNFPTTDGNVYRDNIQEFVSQASAVVENEPKATKDTVNPTNNGSTEDVQPPVVQSKSPILTSEPVNSPTIERVTFPVSAPRPNLRPSIPYPSRLQDQKLRDKANDQREKFFQIFKDLNFNISFADALILMPKFVPLIKSLLTNKDKLCELARTPLNEHCLAVLLKKLPEKLGDPGKFLIPCDFLGKAECLAFFDLDASINLMPLSVWNKLSLPDLSPTFMTLKLVDRSISHLIGVAEDVYVKVGTFHFPIHFVVIDFDADPRVPLILRRYFLKTGKALIDVFKGKLTLRVGKGAITFNIDQTSRYSANYIDMTAKRIDVIDMACEEYSQEVLGFSDVITTGNLTPYYDLIVSTTSPTLTLFRNSDFLLEEVDAFLAIENDPTLSEVDQSYLDSEGDILLLEAFLNDDPSLPPPNQGNYLPGVRKKLKIYEAKSDKSSIDEPPEVELKDLPPHLEYAFLEGDDKFPVIIEKYLSVEEKTGLITVLKSHKRSIAWKLSDIKGIDPEFCTHKILMEEEFEPAVQHQRRVNPKIHDVIKQEKAPSVVTKLKNEITNFRQRPDESLFEAWERYKLSIDRCPNHNMLPVTQIDTFYNGFTLRHRNTINAAVGGTFMKRHPEECYDLIENITTHHNDWDTSAQRSESSISITSSFDTEIAALKVEMAEINKNLMRVLQVNQQVKEVTPNCETCGGLHSFNDCPATVGQTQNLYVARAYQGKTITNPKEESKGIITRNGTAYQGPMIPTTSSSLPSVVERETETESPILNSEPVIARIIKPVVAPVSAPKPNKDKLSELARTSLNEHCLAVLLKKLPEKLGDPDKFLIPCDFPEMAECLALADLGASINLMPLSVWNKLSLPDLSPTCMTLELAYRLISHPVGVAEDVFIKVGTFHFPTDFVVIDFNVNPQVPLILRRSFLKTVRALIDVFEGELTLRVGKEAITFNFDQTSRYSANYNDMTAKRIDVIDMAYEDYSQEVLGFSDVIASSNPTPYYDPIVSTTSLTLTSFGESDFLLEEVNAFLALEDDPTSLEVDHSYVDTEGDILLLEAFLNDDPSLPSPNHGNYLPQFPVIIAKDLSIEEKTALITVLKSHKRAVAWKLSDIKGIDPEFCTYKILMEDDFEPAVQHQRRVNLKIYDVIKNEVLKLLNAGLIYPIFDSLWSHFMVKEGIVLGHKISKEGIVVDKAKVNVIAKLPHPTTVKECVEAFQTFKRKLTKAPILSAADRDLPFELMCDASDFAIGVVLGERQEKHFRPIHYAIKTMTEAESNYITTKKEMLAVVFQGEIDPLGSTPPRVHIQSD